MIAPSALNISLKYFAGADGKLWTYDKLLSRHWSEAPEAAETQNQHGTQSSVGRHFCRLESEVSPIYERVALGEALRGSDRETFGYFLGFLYALTPDMRSVHEGAPKHSMEIILAAYAQHPGLFGSLLRRLEKDPLQPLDLDGVRRMLVQLSKFKAAEPLRDPVVIYAEEFAKLFLQMKWSTVRTEQHYFITCDNPVFRAIDPGAVHPIYGDHGLLNETAEITFPVSKRAALLLHWDKGYAPEEVVPGEWVKNENRKRAYCAESRIYAHAFSADAIRMANAFRNSKFQVRNLGVPDMRAYQGVVVPRRRPAPHRAI
jgi:hypothetical protein